MPPPVLPSGARARSGRYRCWVWSKRGELGRSIRSSQQTAPAPFWGLRNRTTGPASLTHFALPSDPLSPRRQVGGDAEGGGGHPNPHPGQTKNRPTHHQVCRAVMSEERAGDGLFSARGCPPSIVSAAAFHFRVRDGNGWSHRAPITSSPQIVARHSNLPRVTANTSVDYPTGGRSQPGVAARSDMAAQPSANRYHL